jgi:hypothetical protein
MSFQVPTSYVSQYKSNVELLLQQKGSRLRGLVRNETQNAEFDFYDRIGPVEAQEVTGRHQDTPLISTPHDRRRCSLRDFDWADMIDKKDRIRMLIDPTGPYAMNAMYALGRKQDDVIIEAMFDNAWTGKTGSTAVAFPAAQVVAVNYVESGSAANSGLTIGKLRRAKEMMDAAEVDPDEERYIGVTAKQVTDLLKTTEVTSADYNTVKALVEGKVDTFMGFKFTRTERLLTDVNAYRRLPCWVKSGVLFAAGEEINVDIGPRRDKRNSIQVYVNGTFGSTRMDEQKVIEIKCLEA